MPALGAAAIASRSWNGKKGADAEETPPLIKFTEDTCDIEDEAIEKARQLFQRNAFVHSTGRMHWNDVITFLRMVGTNPRPDTVNSWVAANEGKLRAEGERQRLLPGLDFRTMEDMNAAVETVQRESITAAAAAHAAEEGGVPRRSPSPAADVLDESLAASSLLRVTWAEVLHLWQYSCSTRGSEEELLTQAFSFFDRDRSGSVSAAEFKEVMMELGGEPLSEAEIDLFMSVMDSDGNNEVDVKEFIAALKASTGLLMGQKDKAAFDMLDASMTKMDKQKILAGSFITELSKSSVNESWGMVVEPSSPEGKNEAWTADEEQPTAGGGAAEEGQ